MKNKEVNWCRLGWEASAAGPLEVTPSRVGAGWVRLTPCLASLQSRAIIFFAKKKKSEELWVVPDYTPGFSVS